MYKRKKLDWIVLAKSGDGGEDARAVNLNSNVNGIGRSGIELARERFSAGKAKKGKGVRAGSGSGANGM